MCFVDVKSHFPQRWPSVLVAILLVQRPYLLNTTFIPLMAANSSTYISVQVHFLRVTVRPLCRSLGEGTEGARRDVGPPSGSRRQADANEATATSGHRRGPIPSPAERRSVSPCRPRGEQQRKQQAEHQAERSWRSVVGDTARHRQQCRCSWIRTVGQTGQKRQLQRFCWSGSAYGSRCAGDGGRFTGRARDGAKHATSTTGTTFLCRKAKQVYVGDGKGGGHD